MDAIHAVDLFHKQQTHTLRYLLQLLKGVHFFLCNTRSGSIPIFSSKKKNTSNFVFSRIN